jgi:hypothetical protein
LDIKANLDEYTQPLSRPQVQHLLRRATFSLSNSIIDKYVGKTASFVVDELFANADASINPSPPFFHNDHILGIKMLSKGNSDIRELQPYYEFVINSEFNVDNGVPYYTSLNKKVLNLNEIPKIQYDPLKPLRIASLFGWLISNSNNLQEIESRFHKK